MGGCLTRRLGRSSAIPTTLNHLFTGGETGDHWVFDDTHTTHSGVGTDITAATGLVNGLVMTGPDAANRPDLNLVSGRYSALFDGNGDRLKYTFGANVSQPGTIILAGNSTDPNNPKGIVTGSSTTLRWQMSVDGSGNIIIYAGASLDTTRNAALGNQVFTAVYNGASSLSRFNGTQTASGNAGTQQTNQVTIGALYDGTLGFTLNAYSLLFINRILTPTELDGAERLMGTYGGLSW